MALAQTHAGFVTTRWTQLRRLQEGTETERGEALNSLMRAYWPAVYASLRRSGRDREEAGEITQAFFSEVVLGRSLLERAEESSGRLRTLILTALKRFVVDLHRRSSARGGPAVSLDGLEREEAMLADEPADDPEAAFDRRWAVALLDAALERCQRHFEETGKARHWRAFDLRILRPAIGRCAPPPMTAVAAQLGFATPADAAAAVQVVRKRALVFLREAAAETAEGDEAQRAEFAHLLALLGVGAPAPQSVR